MNKKVEVELQKIISDKTSGSEELLEKINFFFSKNIDKLPNAFAVISHLKKHFRTFQNIQNYFRALKKMAASGRLSVDFFKRFEDSSNTAYNKIFINAFPYLKKRKTILTISNSKTVFEILKRLNVTGNMPFVIICESRPKFEGRILAKKLITEKMKVQLITEAQISDFVEKSDCVLIGADVLLKNGGVVNKIGSKTLAIVAKYFRKPFYVVAGRTKFCSQNSFAQKRELPEEIWKNRTKNIILQNYYFETVPKFLITKIISA